MKKLTAILLAALLVFSFAACGQNGGPGKTGEVSVFYYTFSDTYISSVRTAMDSYLKANNIEFNNYDANHADRAGPDGDRQGLLNADRQRS